MARIQNTQMARATQGQNMAAAQPQVKQSTTVMMNSLLDSEGYRKRFEELLGKRTPQFVSALITLCNSTPQLQEAFATAPNTVIQAALKAASFDLPIDPNLGYAYIVPFRNQGRMEATFLLGYKGLLQLAMRTGVYQKINVVDVREGEWKKFNRLTEDIELEFIEDEEQREALPIIGWCGYFRLINGMEKIIYMGRRQIEAHERKNRKGQNMGKGWRENFEAMAAKTVLRQLIGKWGLMSIDYQTATPAAIAAAEAIARGTFDDDNMVETEFAITDGEEMQNEQNADAQNMPGEVHE
jgi:recombination protein RecT